jgi:hypothetical protein
LSILQAGIREVDEEAVELAAVEDEARGGLG